jgi:hypothetical protein
MKMSQGHIISLALIWAVLLFAVGSLHFLIWTAGGVLLLANSIFVHRDIAAGQNLRAGFYAVFGTGGIIALFFNATFLVLKSTPTAPESLQNVFLNRNYILIAALAITFAGAVLTVAMRRHRKAE